MSRTPNLVLGRTMGVIAALAMLSLLAPAAAQYTWIGPNNGSWNNGTNWSPSPGGPPNSATATATFDGTSLGTANIGATVATQSLLFSNPAGNQSITSSASTSLNGVTSITVGAAVTGVETINLANISTGSLLSPNDTNLTITNNSTAGATLVIGPNTVINTPGAGSLFVAGAGTTQISGRIRNGGVAMNGAGVLTLSNAGNSYNGGTYVTTGTLAIGANGAVIPAGSFVTAQAGGTFDLGPYTNFSANALGGIELDGSTLLATGATNSDYYTKAFTMTGGKVDFTNTPYTWIHLTSAAGINTNASPTTATWIGGGTSRFLNDTAIAIPITVAAGTTTSGVDLDAGIILGTNGVSNPGFIKTGPGSMRLSNTGNTANITCAAGAIYSSDLSTNVGAGAFGTLGTGTFTLGNAAVAYDGPTATSAKPMTLTSFGGITIVGAGVNLTLQGVISESVVGSALSVAAADHYDTVLNQFVSPGTLTLTASNTYTGETEVDGNCILAIPTITNGGVNSPIGKSSSAPSNLQLYGSQRKGLLLLTGTDAAYSTDRGVTLYGLYDLYYHGGGAIGVANAGTTLTWSGQITEFPGSPASFTKTGPGTLTLTNTTNNYSGGTFIEAGTLNVGTGGAVIPANTDVTVLDGAVFQIGFGSSSNVDTPIRTLTLNGGTLRVPSGDGNYVINKLVMTAGTVDFTGSGTGYGFGLYLSGTGSAITTNPSPTTANWIGSNNSYIYNYTGAPLTVTVKTGTTPSGIDLDVSAPLFGDAFVKAGAGTMRLTNAQNYADFILQQGRLRVDDVTSANTNAYPTVTNFGALGSGTLTLDGGTLQYAGPTAALTKPLTLASTGTLEVSNAATTLTLRSLITGGGGLTKSGPGLLILDNVANTFAGGFTVNAGRVDVAADASLGLGVVAVNPAGTLRYTASTTAGRTFTLNGGTLELPTGVTLTLNGAAVYGGFFRGASTFAVTGGTVLSGVTTFGSTTVSLTGSASLVNFSNGGPLTVAAALATPTTLSGFTNRGGGTLTIGAASAVTAADFETAGTLTLAPATVGSGQFTILTNTGYSSLYFNGGSRTFLGTPATAGPPNNPNFVAGIDLEGKNAVIAGGLFVNNGFVVDLSSGTPGSIVVDYGALYKGAGYTGIPVITQNGGKVQAGNSPGSASYGKFVFGPGGVSNYVFAIDDATGTAGPSPDAAGHVRGWGLVNAIQHTIGSVTSSGDFVWTATPAAKLTVAIDTLINPTTVGTDIAGPMADFDSSFPYSWPAARWWGAYSGPIDVAALDAATSFDTAGFLNPASGTFGWDLDQAGQTLSLTYTPSAVPEPGTLALISLAAVGLACWRRRSQPTSRPQLGPK